VSVHLCQRDWVAISAKKILHFGKYGPGILVFCFLFSKEREAACVRRERPYV
jgi:hypothetical protein